MTIPDLTPGQRFGRLTCHARAPSDRYGSARWYCICDCGRRKTVQRKVLRSGRVKSCGCYRREVLLANSFNGDVAFWQSVGDWTPEDELPDPDEVAA